jgi:Holliday junction resolvase RusA-like endonuclease
VRLLEGGGQRVKKEHKFTIYGKLPGFNEYTNKCRADKYGAARFKQKIEAEIGWEIIAAGLNNRKFRRMSVHIDFFEPNRRRDEDNVKSAKKFILDAMAKVRTIQGDGQKYIEKITDTLRLDRDNPRVEVTITVLEPF